jgi:hypothetical protein
MIQAFSLIFIFFNIASPCGDMNVTLPLPNRYLTVTDRYRYDRFFRKFNIFFTSLFFYAVIISKHFNLK